MIRWIASVVIAAGIYFARPGAVFEITNGRFVSGIRLDFPAVYLPFAPFFQIADHVTILSLHQHIAMIACIILGWFLFRLDAYRAQRGDAPFIREALLFLSFNLAIAAEIGRASCRERVYVLV